MVIVYIGSLSPKRRSACGSSIRNQRIRCSLPSQIVIQSKINAWTSMLSCNICPRIGSQVEESRRSANQVHKFGTSTVEAMSKSAEYTIPMDWSRMCPAVDLHQSFSSTSRKHDLAFRVGRRGLICHAVQDPVKILDIETRSAMRRSGLGKRPRRKPSASRTGISAV